jgi:2-isopropylmalate synthase
MNILKDRELYGYQYEAAGASFELLVKKALNLYKPSFSVIFFKMTDDYPSHDGSMQSGAMIQLEVQGETETVASVGNGPVNALDIALRKGLCMFYPQIRNMHLSDYKVRVIDSNNNTGARTRVLIESTNGRESWTTIGVSNDIIEASFLALVDSFEYILSKEGV